MIKRILAVDDEAGIRELFREAFRDQGYEVYLAAGGAEALDILKTTAIDVIFLDLKLFGMNGIELCRQIRKTRPLALIHAMTGWSALFDVEECREAGFDDYFTKPLDFELLYRVVEDAFAKLERWRRRHVA